MTYFRPKGTLKGIETPQPSLTYYQLSAASNGPGSSNGYPEDHYESASICYGSPAAAAAVAASAPSAPPSASSHGNTRVAGLKPRNYPRPKGGN